MVIMILDDDPMSRKMLGFLLEGEGFEVVMAESIRAARSILAHTTPILILLDVGLPDGDGFSFCQWLTKEEPQVPVVMLTSYSAHTDKLNGFKYGADDYIVKPYDHSELVARVKAVLRRTSRAQSYLVQDNLRVGDLELSINELKLKKKGFKDIELTPTEMKILSCFMVNVGMVLDRTTIADNALGIDYAGSSNVVDVYVRRLRKKLETDPNNPNYIETVVGSGYRMAKPC
ncbi:MAG: two component transcriptional regulator, winged helix family [Chloroflexi bacterium]|jgi:DNA-binding response OmpR family regulator|nr:two component transcriptional regulator, winged helix family [Chloroflexota bacterium]